VASQTSLADAIAREKVAILACWHERVRQGIDPETAPAWEIIDTLPPFLDEMIQTLRDLGTGDDASSRRGRDIALTHGTERFHNGFSLGAVIREYGALRECLLDFIWDSGLTPTTAELRSVLLTLNTGIANAAEQFTRERDQLIERQSEQHFGFIAHELRNPLASALLSVQMLQRRAGAEGDPTLQRLMRNLSTLRHRIDNSLMSVRVRELGRTQTVEADDVVLRQVAETVRDELADDARERQVAIELEGNARTRADPRLIHSAIANLVGNAVKYTRAGSVIRVRLREMPERVTVEVDDECGGLPEGKAEELFVPFVQRGDNRTGFGLGLAITKDAIEAHQGTVQVVNRPGTGCTFMVTLPVTAPR
jgi:signal transduction histidine kinase